MTRKQLNKNAVSNIVSSLKNEEILPNKLLTFVNNLFRFSWYSIWLREVTKLDLRYYTVISVSFSKLCSKDISKTRVLYIKILSQNGMCVFYEPFRMKPK